MCTQDPAVALSISISTKHEFTSVQTKLTTAAEHYQSGKVALRTTTRGPNSLLTCPRANRNKPSKGARSRPELKFIPGL